MAYSIPLFLKAMMLECDACGKVTDSRYACEFCGQSSFSIENKKKQKKEKEYKELIERVAKLEERLANLTDGT